MSPRKHDALVGRATSFLVHGGLQRTLPVLALVGVVLVATLGLSTEEAWGRVGGGQNFSSGGSRGGGGFSGGGRSGGGGDGDLIFILIWLLVEHPVIGIPVLLIVVGFVVFRAMMQKGGRQVSRTHHDDEQRGWQPSTPSGPPPIEGLLTLRDVDPGFSMPVLLDYLQLLHRRATEAAVTHRWEALAPFVDPSAQQDLEGEHRGVTAVRDVIVGGLQVLRVSPGVDVFTLHVVFQDNRRETLANGGERFVYVEESWTLRRAASAVSKAPDDVMRMGCPSCGAAIDTDREGRCTTCGTPIVTGLLQWQAHSVAFTVRRKVEPPRLGWTDGGMEPSARFPTVVAPGLPHAWRAFRGRHPGFTPDAFQQRVSGIYFALQSAWSESRWDDARPHVTDMLYQTLRFYLEQYTEHGLRNRLGDVALLRQEIVNVQMDAWYEAITVRIVGRMKDWVETTDGKVVGGNPNQDRTFSEYWTFLRAIGSGDETKDTNHCPSCGAPLDNVSQAGVCGYCDTKITTGKFDWVLSRIDQPEAYRG